VTEATGAGSARPQGQPTNRIGDINPNDIATIEVLKGASAAANVWREKHPMVL